MKTENRNERTRGKFRGPASVIALAMSLAGVSCKDSVRARADTARAIADLKILEASLIRYKTNGRKYPTTEQGLEALVSRPTAGPEPAAWEQYIEAAGLTDPWGNPYKYFYPGQVNPQRFDLWSLGPDGKDETGDEISTGDD